MTDNFPTHSLMGLEPLVTEHAENIRVQPSIVAQNVLAVLSGAFQRNFRVINFYSSDSTSDLNLAFVAIAKSGDRKSEVYKDICKPIKEWQGDRERSYRDELKIYETLQTADQNAQKADMRKYANGNIESKAKIEADIRASSQIEKPVSPIVMIEDTTAEALVSFLANYRRSALLVTDEGGKFFEGHSMKRENKTNSFATLNNIISNGSCSQLRKGSGNIFFENASLSLMIYMQPDIMEGNLLRSGANLGQGLYQRILWNKPPSMIGGRFMDYDQEEIAEIAAETHFKQVVHDALNQGCKWDLKPLDATTLEFSKDGRNKLIDFHNELELHNGDGKKYDVISGFISKFPNHTQRIAALLFLYENQNERVIGPEYVENAIEISRYFIDQAFELFGPEASDEVLAHKLCEYLEYCPDQSTERTKILQFGPPELRNKKNRDRATNYAMDKGYIYSPDDKHICLMNQD